ncbi:PH domain-containing protein [Flavobacterium lindanitolerans]|nr:PH domain-containing protein [Flavobacterium lindanitolerans]
MALLLKEKLLDYGNKEEEALDDNQEVIKESKTFLKISYNTLFKVGITSNYGRTIALLVTFVITLYQSFKDAINAFEIDEKEVDTVFERGAGFFSAGILIFGLLVLVLLINIVRIFIKHFDFVMIKQKQSLVITSGLFAKKNTLLNPDKVQITSYSQNYFQKKFRILDMNMKQASSDEVKEQKKKVMQLKFRAAIRKKGMKFLELSSEKFRKRETNTAPIFAT